MLRNNGTEEQPAPQQREKRSRANGGVEVFHRRGARKGSFFLEETGNGGTGVSTVRMACSSLLRPARGFLYRLSATHTAEVPSHRQPA